VRKAGEAPREVPPLERELLRVAALLQDLGQGTNVRSMLPKVINCMIQGTGSEVGCLLVRRGDEVRILGAFGRRGEPVKDIGDLVCLQALELAWDTNQPILAPRVVDDPRVAAHEVLYKNGITALAVLPMRLDSAHRAAVYLTNSDPGQLVGPAGGPILLAYQNLVSLLLPRVIQPQRPSTVR
jgi:hypothetical protein